MNPFLVHVVSGSITKAYWLAEIPGIGDVINWPSEGLVGKVDSRVWTHTNEVTLTLNVAS